MAYGNLLALGGMGAFFGAFMAVGLVIMLALYVYFAFAWMVILKKIGYHTPWLSWIPIVQLVPLLEEGGFHWAWIFVMLVPFLGWLTVGVMAIIGAWKIFEKLKYPGWLTLVPLGGIIPFIGWLFSIAGLVIIGMVAWKDRN